MEGLSSEISEFPGQSIYSLWTVPAADTERVDICFYYNYFKNSSLGFLSLIKKLNFLIQYIWVIPDMNWYEWYVVISG